MQRFQFSLENILSLRKHEESTLLTQYAAAISNLSKTRARTTSLKKRLTDEWRIHEEKLQDDVSPEAIQQRQIGWAYIEEQIEQAEQATIDCEDKVEHLAQALREKRQERESLDSYRDEGWRAHRLELNRLEQLEIDELATRGARQRY